MTPANNSLLVLKSGMAIIPFWWLRIMKTQDIQGAYLIGRMLVHSGEGPVDRWGPVESGKVISWRSLPNRSINHTILVNFAQMSRWRSGRFLTNYLATPGWFFSARLQLWSGKKTVWTRISYNIWRGTAAILRAREAIKWLVADGRYSYIETGSLVSIRKSVEGITLPSGRGAYRYVSHGFWGVPLGNGWRDVDAIYSRACPRSQANGGGIAPQGYGPIYDYIW